MLDERDVVALHVERILHAFGAGEGGRVEEDEVVLAACALRLLGEPAGAVGLDVAVLGAGEAVQRHVAFGPVEVGVRHVDGGGAARPAGGGVQGGDPGVGEEVEEAFAPGLLLNHRAGGAVVEE